MLNNQLEWQVGDVTITPFVEIANAGDIIQEILPEARNDRVQSISWLVPHFADEDGTLKAVVQAFVVATPTRRIIIDTCVGDGRVRPDLPAWQNLQTGFLEKLKTRGVPPESIDTVLCTHLHFDHVGWNTTYVGGRWVPTFRSARYLFARDEFHYWKDRPAAEIESDHNGFADSVLPVFEAGCVELVSTNHQVCPEITLIPTPGHTPAHVSVLIDSKGHQALITGDVMHHPCQIANPGWNTLSDTSKEMAKATREALLKRVATGNILLIGSHFASPTAGYVRRAGSDYRLEV
jgi:glyoxylase-like metal-dependent hydrolase (beta-lactamase superfamily II)